MSPFTPYGPSWASVGGTTWIENAQGEGTVPPPIFCLPLWQLRPAAFLTPTHPNGRACAHFGHGQGEAQVLAHRSVGAPKFFLENNCLIN